MSRSVRPQGGLSRRFASPSTPAPSSRRAVRWRAAAARGLLACAAAASVAGAHCAAGAARPIGAELLSGSLPADPVEAGARKVLLELYAPVVLLAPGERRLPASVEWVLARSRPDPAGGVVLASMADVPRSQRLRVARSAWNGSSAPADWTVYGHVYRSADGGLLLQYWFLYPYNSFHRLGDHEGDWEHVTVRLSAEGRPLGAWYARHDANAPGVWSPWTAIRREGSHPVVLSARGSHASYARVDEVAWLERTCPTTRPEQAARQGCRVWRTGSGSTGGVVDLGTLDAPAVPFLLWQGRWGADGGISDSEGGPPGPGFQPGWCSGGAASCS